MKLLENKIALITGAGRGIGRVIAEQFAQDGATVYVNDLQIGDMEEWAADCSARNKVKVVPICFDVTDSSAMKSALMTIYKTEGRIDCVVNNAAIIANQKLGMVTKALLEKIYSVNVFSLIDMLQIASRLMTRTGGGCFVNIASITGVVGSPGQVAYSSSKGAVIAITKSAAKELSPQQIRVNAVAPGITETDMMKAVPREVIEPMIERIPLRRLGQPEDIANAFVFLASDEASYITGVILSVDGMARS